MTARGQTLETAAECMINSLSATMSHRPFSTRACLTALFHQSKAHVTHSPGTEPVTKVPPDQPSRCRNTKLLRTSADPWARLHRRRRPSCLPAYQWAWLQERGPGGFWNNKNVRDLWLTQLTGLLGSAVEGAKWVTRLLCTNLGEFDATGSTYTAPDGTKAEESWERCPATRSLRQQSARANTCVGRPPLCAARREDCVTSRAECACVECGWVSPCAGRESRK